MMRGSNSYPKEWTEKLCESIRERDSYVCVMCGGQDERSLCVHHIDQVKQNCDPANLISLCNSCHMQVHGMVQGPVAQLERRSWHGAGWLNQKYWEEGLTATQIAKDEGCQTGTITKWMGRHGIPQRSFSASCSKGWRLREQQGNQREEPSQFWQDVDWLKRKYWKEKLNLTEIGKLVGCSPATIRKWMIRFDVPRRTISEALKLVLHSETRVEARELRRQERKRLALERNAALRKWYRRSS